MTGKYWETMLLKSLNFKITKGSLINGKFYSKL